MADSDSRALRYHRAIELLKAARSKSGLSQAQLAGILGTRQQFVSKYECIERRLDVIEFFDIARALHLQPKQIFDVLRL